MTFTGFLRWSIATHPNYNSDAQSIRAAVRLERIVDKLEELSLPTFDLDWEDWERLKTVVENPQGGYPIRPGSRMLPFVDAITGATAKE